MIESVTLFLWLYSKNQDGPIKLAIDTKNMKECTKLGKKIERDKFIKLDNGKILKFEDYHFECVN